MSRFHPKAIASLAIALIAAGCCVGVSARCGAEDYPTRAIKVIVPFSPGGSTDAMARHVKREIEERQLLPQPMVIVNIEGAGSAIGSRRAKNAEPDGYTIMVLNEAIVTSKYWGTVPYGPDAFEPIAATGEAGTVLTVREDCEFKNLGEMLRAAKERPREIRAAVALGTPSHFACLGAQAALPGAEFRHAQFGGGAHRFAALKGGHVDLTTFSSDEFRRFREEGLRGLAYLGTDRNADLPNVPTAMEQGFDVQRSIMLYWWAPKNTPAERIKVLGDALQQAMEGEKLRDRLKQSSVDPVFLRGETLKRKLVQVEADIQSVDPRRQLQLPNMVFWTLLVITGFAIWSFFDGTKPGTSQDVAAIDPPAGLVENDISESLAIPQARSAERTRTVTALGASIAFVLALASGFAPLGPTIAIFMIVCGGILGAFRSRGMGIFLVVGAIALAIGFDVLFTQLLNIDL